MNYEKEQIYTFTSVFSVIIAIYFIYAYFYRINYINNNFDPAPSNYYETLVYPDAKEIIYDENYAVNISIKIYEQLYNKTFSKDDLDVSDESFFGFDIPCWRVCLNVSALVELNKFKDVSSTFDAPTGLLIYKKTGAVMVNNGEFEIEGV